MRRKMTFLTNSVVTVYLVYELVFYELEIIQITRRKLLFKKAKIIFISLLAAGTRGYTTCRLHDSDSHLRFPLQSRIVS